MDFGDFKIHSIPRIMEAYCKECSKLLEEVPNGWVSVAMFCSKCEAVYELKLVKTPKKKINPEWLKRVKKSLEREKEESKKRREEKERERD